MLSNDAAMARVVAGFIGDETELQRTQPDLMVAPGTSVTLGGIDLVATNFGDIESGADTVWTTRSLPEVMFSGDLVMVGTHLSLYQGRSGLYLAAARRLQAEAGPGTLFAAGHDGLVPPHAIDRQIAYLDAYRAAVEDLAQGQPSMGDTAKIELV